MGDDEERRIDQLQTAADAAAGHIRNLYITFLLFGLYLAITVASTTHEQLLRSGPVELPIVNVKVPLFGFYWIAPALYVLLHFNLLVQLALLANKLHRLDEAIEQYVRVASQRVVRRDLLGHFAFSHMLIGRHHRASLRFFLRSMIVVSMVLLPIVILLFTQFRFLPYHSVTTAWAHRVLVVIDLLLVLLLWLKVRYPLDDFRTRPGHWLLHRVPALAGTILALSCSFSMAVPGETLINWLEASMGRDRYGWLFSLSVRKSSLVTAWPTMEQIEQFGEDTAWQNFGEPINLSLRDLRYGSFEGSIFTHANLSGADFRSADLADSDLIGADLIHTNFSGADLTRANLMGANLSDAKLIDATVISAILNDAELSNADLTGARLHSADLSGANFRGANLIDATLIGANLGNAKLVGADLTSAKLIDTNLEGANLTDSDLSGVNLRRANLTDANLNRATLTSADHLRGAMQICSTVMPDATRCNRDCPEEPSQDKSCPWFEKKEAR